MRALSGIEAIIPLAVAADPRFLDAVSRQLRRRADEGAIAVLAP